MNSERLFLYHADAWVLFHRGRDVGIIIDLAVHDIDAISYLYGKRALNVYSIAGTPHKIRKVTITATEEEWHTPIIWSRALRYGNKM